MNAEPKSWLSNDWMVYDDDGREVLLDVATWREGAALELDGESYAFVKTGFFKSELTLRRGEEILAEAAQQSGWRDRFLVDFEGEHLTFEKASFWSSRFEVRQGSETIGTIARQGLFSRRCSIDLPDDWPLPVRVFLFWIAVLLWNRESAAAAT